MDAFIELCGSFCGERVIVARAMTYTWPAADCCTWCCPYRRGAPQSFRVAAAATCWSGRAAAAQSAPANRLSCPFAADRRWACRRGRAAAMATATQTSPWRVDGWPMGGADGFSG